MYLGNELGEMMGGASKGIGGAVRGGVSTMTSPFGAALGGVSEGLGFQGPPPIDYERLMRINEEQQIAMENRARAQREQDLARGKARGEELFSEGALGRMEEGRAAEIADIISRRQAESQGFTPQEMQAMREQNMTEIGRQQAAQQRQLRSEQARSGVRGATASAQKAAQQQAFQGQMTQSERDLFLKNIDARRAGMDKLEGSVTAARGEELARKEYNLQSANKERFARLATEFAYGSLGAEDRAAALQAITAQNAARFQGELANQKGKK